MAEVTYVIKTNLPPEAVTQIGMEIFARWVEFALGQASLGGRRLIYPTGRYASSISFQRVGAASVAIVADESVAPEAAVLEYGHGPVDLKTKLRPGVYPMHRPPGGSAHQSATGLLRRGSGPPGMKPRMWAEIRQREASGYASVSPNSPPGSWIIPAMTPYAPAMMLAAMARSMAGGS
jgi:hypothetical protein